MKKDPKVIERRLWLFDLLVDNPDGLRYPEVEEETGWSSCIFQATVQSLRDWLAVDGNDIDGVHYTLPCDPEPGNWRGPWVYCLTPGDEVEPSAAAAEGKRWLINRLSDVDRRLVTVQNTTVNIVRQTDGRTVVGKKARDLHKTISRAMEDLDELVEVYDDINQFTTNGAS